MFNYYIPDRATQLRVVLMTDKGRVIGPADPWPLLPLEFFRVISFIIRVFISSPDKVVRDRFCEAAIKGLNERPWRDWDEVRASFTAPPGERFAGMELYMVEVDFRMCDPGDRAHVLKADLIHRYDPGGWFGDAPERSFWRTVDGAGEERDES
ncbi:hypothetical protein [Nonomuraea diastatica]|uniref:Uncharacterized protein n=1 Tax=Nonomuraea diastatica TaxID=1848329 RepID=A0A4R4WRI9_9ACTN|nr:hypothetical protein [Nonomuraea diastatica]TDD20285.1 hypothetical protein E1294_18455 [Nonomuraea diastatica]